VSHCQTSFDKRLAWQEDNDRLANGEDRNVRRQSMADVDALR
jgi:hypothetical protein